MRARRRRRLLLGQGGYGQLGNGTRDLDQDVPVPVSGGRAWATITTGFLHTCGITEAGVAYCWGSSAFGGLGIGRTAADSMPWVTTPLPVAGDRTFAAMAVGRAESCALTPDGATYCWGYLDGAAQHQPVLIFDEPALSSPRMAAGHSCGLTDSGTAFCWGSNDQGQLGNGTTSPSEAPVEVIGSSRFTTLDVGHTHTCAVTTDGSVFCWGDNSFGQLGGDTTTSRSTPTPIDTSGIH